MNTSLRELLISYADRYETPSFIEGDPSWFMHQVVGRENQEVMAFIASALSYGSRKQFLPKIQLLLNASEGEPYEWVNLGKFSDIIPDTQQCFYRLYTNHTMYVFLQALRQILIDYGSLGQFAEDAIQKHNPKHKGAITVLTTLSNYFWNQGLKGIVPHPISSLCKRPNMFLRWMVRNNSPVDLGLWTDIIDKSSLIIPMDTHVMQTARSFNLFKTKTASWATTISLTQKLSEVFPGDPVRGDYALYGADIDKDLNDFAKE